MANRRGVTYDRPVSAKLMVELGNGEKFEAGPEDLLKFGYIDSYTASIMVHRWWSATLDAHGLDYRDVGVAGALLNAVDCAAYGTDMPGPEVAARAADAERALRAVLGEDPDERGDGAAALDAVTALRLHAATAHGLDAFTMPLAQLLADHEHEHATPGCTHDRDER